MVRIVTDSASDLTAEVAKEWGVEVLPLHVFFGDTEYLDGQTITHGQFYEKLVETAELPKTSQVSPAQFADAFEAAEKAGDEVVCITLSSKLSGCFQSANIALEDYEDRVSVVDSLNASLGERLLVQLACWLRDDGKSREEIAEQLEREKGNIRVISLFDTLEYLKRGGRISGAAAMAGGLLSIKPLISVIDGEVKNVGKARGSKNGQARLREYIEGEGGINFRRPYCLAYSGLSDALLQKYIKDSEAIWKGETDYLPITTIGAAIGTHAGPNCIAASFFVNGKD